MSEYAKREAALDRINDDPAWAQKAYGAAMGMSSYYFGNFYCEDRDSPGACTVQCSLCKIKTPKGGDTDPRTSKEKLQAIRRHLSQLSHTQTER